jgi:hypothetical protein
MDASPIPVSMSNDSELASRFGPLRWQARPPAENPMVKTKLRGLALLRTFLVTGKLYEHKTAGQRA